MKNLALMTLVYVLHEFRVFKSLISVNSAIISGLWHILEPENHKVESFATL